MPCARCPCKSLNNRIRCIHSRKSKATANHLRTLTNGYYLAEHTWLHNHNAAPIRKNFCEKHKAAHEFTRQFAPLRATLILSARPDRIPTGYRAGHHMNSCRALTRSAPVPRPPPHAAPIRKNFCRKRKAAHEFTRHFAPLRAALILSARTDRIQSRASHEFMPRFAPLCACAPPAATTPAAFARLPSPVSRDAPRIFLPNLTKSLARALLPVNPSNRPKKASDLNPI